MESLFTYTDFRKYLADFYEEKKQTTRYFTYRYFSQKAGFKSPQPAPADQQGKRNLTEPALFAWSNS